jgi:uncharacterized protein YbjT (DUF2867 family)
MGMNVAITGGTGTIGRPTAEALRARNHDVRVLSRSSEAYPVDLVTGEGLDAALEGVDVVIDAANGASTSAKDARAVLVDGGRRLLAAEAKAGVSHHVCISIVGIDEVPSAYYRVKVEQEKLVEAGATPWTIVRATQFHDLVALIFGKTARFGVLPGAAARLQPVAVTEVAEVVAAVAEGEPRHGRVTVAGPEVRTARELAQAWKAARASRALVLPLPLVGASGKALRAGRLTDPRPDHRGAVTFERWLRTARR